MCGFVGFFLPDSSCFDSIEAVVKLMALSIAHRGPDDSGAWADERFGIALGHRRLSVLDLSSAGHQPMQSNSGRFVLAFNGEIYNHLDLRIELEQINSSNSLFTDGGLNWQGHSDTETLLAGFEAWGVETTLKKTVGMFSFALWDTLTRTLHLARDRFGEKPLYYGWVGNGSGAAFVFGSELKALRAYPTFANPISREALALYMRFTYVPAPHSIYQFVFKLEPGCMISLSGGLPPAPNTPMRPPSIHGGFSLQRWWSLAEVVQDGILNQIVDEAEALQALEKRLTEAVRLQTLADVPLGAFLSGGVDSSTIVALMQQQASRPVNTFTVGFEEAEFDESHYAKAVAKHLGTDHTEIFVTALEAQAVIPQLSAIYDEPFADSSQIPTHLVCKAARQKVTVALSGDAGDELFGGYPRYFWHQRIWSKLSWLPYSLRHVMGKAIRGLPVSGWDILSHSLNSLLPAFKGITNAGDKAYKLADRLGGVRNLDDLYLSLVSEWQDPASVVCGYSSVAILEPPSLLSDPLPKNYMLSTENYPLSMMYRDSITYLPDDILCKVDRASMSISLETRVPFLDHRVAELAWQLPLNMKIRDNEGKWALRQVLYRHVPRELIDRPKSGFGIPIGQWLRGPLREWAESLLDEKRLRREGYFYPAKIRQNWAEHLSNQRDHTVRLWTVLMFQAWLEDQNN